MRDTHRHVGEGERRDNKLKKGNSWDAAEPWRGRGTSSRIFASANAPIRGMRFVRFWRVLVVSLFHIPNTIFDLFIVFVLCER